MWDRCRVFISGRSSPVFGWISNLIKQPWRKICYWKDLKKKNLSSLKRISLMLLVHLVVYWFQIKNGWSCFNSYLLVLNHRFWRKRNSQWFFFLLLLNILVIPKFKITTDNWILLLLDTLNQKCQAWNHWVLIQWTNWHRHQRQCKSFQTTQNWYHSFWRL